MEFDMKDKLLDRYVSKAATLELELEMERLTNTELRNRIAELENIPQTEEG